MCGVRDQGGGVCMNGKGAPVRAGGGGGGAMRAGGRAHQEGVRPYEQEGGACPCKHERGVPV